MEGASRGLGQERRKTALQWQLRLEASRYKCEMNRVVDEGGREGERVRVGMGALTNIIIWGSDTRMGKASGAVKSGAEKVKATPKSSPRQNRPKEQTSRKVGRGQEPAKGR